MITIYPRNDALFGTIYYGRLFMSILKHDADDGWKTMTQERDGYLLCDYMHFNNYLSDKTFTYSI